MKRLRLVLLLILIALFPAMQCAARDVDRIQGAQQGQDARLDAKAQLSRNRQEMHRSVVDYMASIENDPKLGGLMRLGNRSAFNIILQQDDLEVKYVRGLAKDGTLGKFHEPGARLPGAFGAVPDRFNPYGGLFEIDADEGRGPNRTVWHEAIHAVIYYQKWRDIPCLGSTYKEKEEREEAFTWLMEDRLDFIGTQILSKFADDYEKVKNERDRARRAQLVPAINQKIARIESMWNEKKLQEGPSAYQSEVIQPECVKELEGLLGIKMDLPKLLREKYPPLPLEPPVHLQGYPGGGVWMRQSPKFSMRYSQVDYRMKTVLCPAARRGNYSPVQLNFTEPPAVILKGDAVSLSLTTTPLGRGFASLGQAGWYCSGFAMNTFNSQPATGNGPGRSDAQFVVTYPPGVYDWPDASIRASWVGNSTNESIQWVYKWILNPTSAQVEGAASTSGVESPPPQRLTPPSTGSVQASPVFESGSTPNSSSPTVSHFSLPGWPGATPTNSGRNSAPSTLNTQQPATSSGATSSAPTPAFGTVSSESTSNQLLQRAQQGDARAQFSVGLSLANKQQYAEALVWYERAAQQGNPEAQNNLGTLLYQGKGCATDYKRAAYWIGKAAEQGLPQGLASMGSLLYHGAGVPQNKKKGIALLKAGARKGNPKAIEKLNQLGIKLDDDDNDDDDDDDD